MIVLLKIEGRKTTATVNGHTMEFNTAFLKKLSFKDAIMWMESESKKLK